MRAMNSSTQSFPSHPASAPTATRLIPGLALCGCLVLLAGCVTEPESHIVSAPPPPTPTKQITTTTTTSSAPVAVQTAPVYVSNAGYTTTQAVPVASTVVITQAPPQLQQEVILAQPTTRHIWLPGYWTWQNDRYEWMAGHWELPPASATVWVAPRWEQQGNAYKFTEGYWN